MKTGVLLASIALPVIWAGNAFAQVSIPLPRGSGQPAGSDVPPAVPVPLPGTSVPAPPAASTPFPSVPIGPHGRPDINPYDRDIEMTVPLTFQDKSLGDIPFQLTADDRYFLDAPTFLRLMQPILSEEAHVVLSERLNGLKTFGPDNLARTGVSLTYDPSTLSVVVVEVSPEQRAIQNLFAARRDDRNDVNLAPTRFSAYLNLNLSQDYIWTLSSAPPPTINFDGAIRFGRIVFEGDARFGQTNNLADTEVVQTL